MYDRGYFFPGKVKIMKLLPVNEDILSTMTLLSQEDEPSEGDTRKNGMLSVSS